MEMRFFCKPIKICHNSESNQGHRDFQSLALPTELLWHKIILSTKKNEVKPLFSIKKDAYFHELNPKTRQNKKSQF